MIYLLRSNDINPDPRLFKYKNFLEKKRIKYKIFGWDRKNEGLNKKNIEYFKLKTSYGLGNKNIFNLLKWNLYLLKKMVRERKKIKIIHACDFDTILPAIFMKIFFNKKVIFDIFDWYSDSRDFSNKFLKKIINFLEKKAVKWSNYIILCEEERVAQLEMKNLNKENILIMPNIPVFDYKLKEEKNKFFSISYVGIFSKDRGLIELCKIVEKLNIPLTIAGFGDLEEEIAKYGQKNKNINFIGKVDYKKGLEIMKSSSLIYAMYYKESRNNIYAAPNKYYEGLFLSKPIITTKGTLVGEKTLKDKTGFVIDEGMENLEKCLLNIDKKEIEETSYNGKKLWEEKYINYIENFLNDKYYKILRRE